MKIRQLLEGVIIFDISSRNKGIVQSRISLSSGLVTSSSNKTGQKYWDASYIPADPWRTPNAVELKLLYSDDWATLGDQIIVLDIPDDILKPISWMQEIAKGGRLLEMNKAIKESSHDELEEVCNNVLKHAGEVGISINEPIRKLGVMVSEPNLTTVTYDPEQNHFVGLHIDSWFGSPWNTRHLAPNRIAVNVGLEPRYLVFMNLTIRQLYERLIEVGYSSSSLTSLGPDFATLVTRHFDQYPIVRVKIYPGEAYIAPTENIVHDGSTIGNKYLDLNLTILGMLGRVV